MVWAGVVFGLAGLARQTTLIFPLCLVLAILCSGRQSSITTRLRSNALRACAFVVLAVIPFLVYSAILYFWLGDVGKGTFLERVPFAGLVESREWGLERQGVVLATVVAPALIAGAAAIIALGRRIWRIEFLFLLTNVVVFVVLLGRLSYGDGYTSVSRVTSGVVLAGVLCMPWLRDAGASARRAMGISSALWLSMLPVIFVYGFGG